MGMSHETCNNTLFKNLHPSLHGHVKLESSEESVEADGDMIKGTCVNRNSLECAMP